MTPSQYIRQWCGSQGYAYKYGNPAHINVWMGETDFSASTDGVCVFAHLLTGSDYDPSGHDRHNLAIYFATLTPFDFDTDTIDQVTEGLHARAKSLLSHIQQGNDFGWEGARFQYGYDDYAENVAWCCLRVTLTALSADCVPMPKEETQYAGWWANSADQENTGLPAGEYVQFDVYDGHQVLACGGIMPQAEEEIK